MKKNWTKGEEDVEEFKQLLSLSKPVLDKLSKVCYNKLKSYNELKYKKPDYNEPNWPVVQADLNGYARAYNEIIELIESIEE